MDCRKKLIVEPGSKVKLAEVDPGYHGTHESAKAAAQDLQANVARLAKLQFLRYAERKQALLIVIQGIDAADKDGTCWHGDEPAGHDRDSVQADTEGVRA